MAKPDWDSDSERLAANLSLLLRDAAASAARREPITSAEMRDWHAKLMDGLALPDDGFAGCFRGEGAGVNMGVRIGGRFGTPPDQVVEALVEFDNRLRDTIDTLDRAIGSNGTQSADELAAVLELCAWAHAEWVRIHPFTNGNGRTARLWANVIALRYGLPPFVRLRPRPGGEYGDCSRRAMDGEWRPTLSVFKAMLSDTIKRR